MEEYEDMEFLKSNGLEMYAGLFAAMKDGNIRLFESEISDKEEIFIDHGTFLFIEKLKSVVS